MKTLLSILLSAASCFAAQLPIPNSNFTFAYDGEVWREVGEHATQDVWAFTDKGLYSSSGIMRIDVGTDYPLSDQQLGELVGGVLTLKEKKKDFSVYTLKVEGKGTERWLSYYASGTVAYIVFVEAEASFLTENKSSVLHFLSGLQKNKK